MYDKFFQMLHIPINVVYNSYFMKSKKDIWNKIIEFLT